NRMEVDAAQRLMRLQEVIDSSPQFSVVVAGGVEEGPPLKRIFRDRGQEDRSGSIDINRHGNLAAMNAPGSNARPEPRISRPVPAAERDVVTRGGQSMRNSTRRARRTSADKPSRSRSRAARRPPPAITQRSI